MYAAGTHTTDSLDYGAAADQNDMLGVQFWHSQGYRGQGVRIAFFDSGFQALPTNSGFQALFGRNGVLATKDFFTQEPLTYSQDQHGALTLSTTAGFRAGLFAGTAIDADFVLARTESIAFERNIEEIKWVDSIGVDLINSSLGYDIFDAGQTSYSTAEIDGQTTIVAQAAKDALQRGILVINSAGNEGNTTRGMITSPCDVPELLCVGAVNIDGFYSSFSGRGPTSDGRIKPDVVAMGAGARYLSVNGDLASGSGTSFSAPIVTGFVASLLSAHPNATRQELYWATKKSADRFLSPDNRYGWGIPNAQRADSLIQTEGVRAQAPIVPPALLLGPNPTPEGQAAWIEIWAPNTHGWQAQVLDYQGRVVWQAQNLPTAVRFALPSAELPAGLYLVQIAHPSSGQKHTLRWVKG
jgi:subtilisin family serine protease